MKYFIILLTILSFFVIALPISADITTDQLLKDSNLSSTTREDIALTISSTTREAIVKAINDSENKRIVGVLSNPESMNKIQNFVDAFANEIAKTCRILNVEVNEFIKTDVGKLAGFLITYNIIGKDVIRIGICSIALTILTTIWIVFLFLSLTKSKKKKCIIKEGDRTIEIPLSKLSWTIYRNGIETEYVKEVSIAIATIIWGLFSTILLYNII